MNKLFDGVRCQLFHGHWAEVVSYSRQGAWRCTKPGCAAQARHDREIARRGQHPTEPASIRTAAPQHVQSRHAA
jgi:hypothetical protein